VNKKKGNSVNQLCIVEGEFGLAWLIKVRGILLFLFIIFFIIILLVLGIIFLAYYCLN
jgi:hypothetical protein